MISPAFISIKADEPSPLDTNGEDSAGMTAEEQEAFEKAVEEMKNETLEMKDPMPTSAQLLAEGPFVAQAHDVAGKALLIDTAHGKVLRFEGFETINGPNLHIYLSAGLGDEDYIDLGEIKATKGSVNYMVPEGVDTEKYRYVLVWCVPFKVLFSYADLQ